MNLLFWKGAVLQLGDNLSKGLGHSRFRSTFVAVCSAQSLQSCPALCHPMGSSLPGSSVHGICQARILEWIAMPSSRGSSWPRDQTCVSMSPALGGGFFTTSATWEAQYIHGPSLNHPCFHCSTWPHSPVSWSLQVPLVLFLQRLSVVYPAGVHKGWLERS